MRYHSKSANLPEVPGVEILALARVLRVGSTQIAVKICLTWYVLVILVVHPFYIVCYYVSKPTLEAA